MSNFKCKECGTVNIDCGKEGFKTTKEIELEKKLKIAEEALNDIECQGSSCWCKFCKDRIIKALQKMKEVRND